MEERFIRNMGPITPHEQEILKNSKVFIAGCGGIGGFIIEHLTRCGVGHMVCADADRFDSSNLNRQILAVTNTIGEKKAKCAHNRIRSISPDTAITIIDVILDENNLPKLIDGCDLVMDALDNVPGRLALEKACTQAAIPLVHGAVSGWHAQAAIIMPGRNLYETLYHHETEASPTTSPTGILSFTAGIAAAMQSSLAIQYLCGQSSSDELFLFNLEDMNFEKIKFM